MAGMFYSLQDAAERLNKTEDQLRDIVRAGKLREFRDGPNLLFKVDEVEALVVEEGVPIKVEGLEAEAPLELEIPQGEEQPFEPAAELDIPSESETPQMEIPELEIPESELPELEPEPQAGTSEILLAPETGAAVPPSELTNADTAITGQGISVLGETDKDYEITDDTLAETVGTRGLGATGTTPEASLEEIEGDVNLDSLGSGSGLLDLSLQADDTSLGGILDEIYTAEDEAVEPAEAGTAEDVAAEAEQMVAEDELVTPQTAVEMPALVQARFEMAPDKASDILGALLFLPLLFVLYTAIVTVGGLRGVLPSVLAVIQGFIWYIVIGCSVIALGVSGWAFMGDREAARDIAPAAKKPKKQTAPDKENKPRKEKPKKAKKGK